MHAYKIELISATSEKRVFHSSQLLTIPDIYT